MKRVTPDERRTKLEEEEKDFILIHLKSSSEWTHLPRKISYPISDTFHPTIDPESSTPPSFNILPLVPGTHFPFAIPKLCTEST
jgi:hypothetical protein